MSAVFVLCWTSVNYQLAFIGLAINEKAQPQNVTAATTISEAQERASDRHVYLQSSKIACQLRGKRDVSQSDLDKTAFR